MRMPSTPAELEAAIRQMRDEVTMHGARELLTPSDVDTALKNQKGTALVFINSVCGCAARGARPGLSEALKAAKAKPQKLFTVFAGQEKDATAQVRSYFPDIPPSSPSAALFKDGKVVAFVPRSHIEGRGADMVADEFRQIFEQYCS